MKDLLLKIRDRKEKRELTSCVCGAAPSMNKDYAGYWYAECPECHVRTGKYQCIRDAARAWNKMQKFGLKSKK